jgi:hypothetical protein
MHSAMPDIACGRAKLPVNQGLMIWIECVFRSTVMWRGSARHRAALPPAFRVTIDAASSSGRKGGITARAHALPYLWARSYMVEARGGWVTNLNDRCCDLPRAQTLRRRSQGDRRGEPAPGY